jgi:hypothetical protein
MITNYEGSTGIILACRRKKETPSQSFVRIGAQTSTAFPGFTPDFSGVRPSPSDFAIFFQLQDVDGPSLMRSHRKWIESAVRAFLYLLVWRLGGFYPPTYTIGSSLKLTMTSVFCRPLPPQGHLMILPLGFPLRLSQSGVMRVDGRGQEPPLRGGQ